MKKSKNKNLNLVKKGIYKFQKVDNLISLIYKNGFNLGNILNSFKRIHQQYIKKVTYGKGFQYFIVNIKFTFYIF